MYKQETQVQGEQMENVVFHKNRNHNRFTSKKKRTEHGFQPYVTYLASKNEVSEGLKFSYGTNGNTVYVPK